MRDGLTGLNFFFALAVAGNLSFRKVEKIIRNLSLINKQRETMGLDVLDKRLLQNLSSGVSSYEELARECNVSRNTVYRRIAVLEQKGIITKTIRSIVDFEQLDIVALCVGAKMPETEQEKAVALLGTNGNVKLLWRAYGKHNMIAIAFCERGKEGEIVHDLRSVLEQLGATELDVSVGFRWEKMDLTPFPEEIEFEKSAVEETGKDKIKLRRNYVVGTAFSD
jgi:DNA-binding Lrp family transcriptional regulator